MEREQPVHQSKLGRGFYKYCMSGIAELLGRNTSKSGQTIRSFPLTKPICVIKHRSGAFTPSQGPGRSLQPFGDLYQSGPQLLFMLSTIPHRIPFWGGHEHHTAHIATHSQRLLRATLFHSSGSFLWLPSTLVSITNPLLHWLSITQCLAGTTLLIPLLPPASSQPPQQLFFQLKIFMCSSEIYSSKKKHLLLTNFPKVSPGNFIFFFPQGTKDFKFFKRTARPVQIAQQNHLRNWRQRHDMLLLKSHSFI